MRFFRPALVLAVAWFVTILLPESVRAQSEQVSSDSLRPDSAITVPLRQPLKSGQTAVIRSLMFPGLGQVYVESYWKAGLFGTATVGLVSSIVYSHVKYDDFRQQHATAITSGTDARTVSFLFQQREFYRDSRDLFGLYLLGTYIIAAVDAYVGANLFEFDVDDIGASARLEPRIEPQFLGAGLAIRF